MTWALMRSFGVTRGRFHSRSSPGHLRVFSNHFIFKINVGKRRIRHATTLNLNDVICNRLLVDLEIHHSNSESLFVGSDSFRD